MARAIMAERREMGPGERADRARTRTKWAMLVGSLVFGGILGGLVGGADQGNGGLFSHPERLILSPALSITLAIGFVIGFVGLPVYFYGKVDELKVRINLQGMAGGCLTVLGGYPAWQMLAAGGFMPQPTALGIFALCYFGMLVVYLAARYRS